MMITFAQKISRYCNFNLNFSIRCVSYSHRKRINIEEKAKVVAAV